MANQKQIKKRVNSIKNIRKITSALEMVSASRVQKAIDKALAAKPYADKVYELVQAMSGERDETLPLLRKPSALRRDLYIVISTNKGLAGSLNTSLFSALNARLRESTAPHKFITVGQKGRTLALKNGELVADFSDNEPFEDNIPGILEIITNSFTTDKDEDAVDAVYLVYSDFNTVMSQEPKIKTLLPISKDPTSSRKGETTIGARYSFEPSSSEVLEKLLIFYLENQIRDGIHEAEASEHAARMIAMKAASDNAKELAESLSLEYNKARQASITNEIADVVTSTESLSN